MTVFVVRHLTKYRYKRPVRLGEHRLMFRPRDSFDQRLLRSDLVIARGRDAADVAISPSFGATRLTKFKVVTEQVVSDGIFSAQVAPQLNAA